MVDNHFVSLCVKSTGHLSRTTHGGETGPDGDRGTAHRGRTTAQTQSCAGRGGTAARGIAAGGERVGTTAERGGWRSEQAQGQDLGATALARRDAVRGTFDGIAQGYAASRLPDRVVDGQTRPRAGQARVQRRVQQYRLLGFVAQPRLFAAEAGETSAPARRRSHRD